MPIGIGGFGRIKLLIYDNSSLVSEKDIRGVRGTREGKSCLVNDI
jgi:hypothetical protein